MNRIDFMGRLALLLSDIPESEREEAIQYYNDYLNDAGVESEEEVLSELGTPEQLAASIKEGMRDGSAAQGEFSENGYQENGGKSENEVISRKYREEDRKTAGTAGGAGRTDAGGQNTRNGSGNGNLDRRYRNGRKKGMSGGMIALIVILCVLTAPVTFPLIFVLGLVLFILALVMIPVILVILFAGVICVIAGIVSFFGAVVELFTFPAGAVLGIGMSLFTVGLGILLTLGIGWILAKVFPKAFRKTVDFFSGLFHKKGGNKA